MLATADPCSNKLSQLPFGKVSKYELKHLGQGPQILEECHVIPTHKVQGGNSPGRQLTCERHHFVSPLLVHKVPFSYTQDDTLGECCSPMVG